MAGQNTGFGITSRERNSLRRLVRTSRQGSNPGGGSGPYRTPPFLSYDPAIESERRAAERALRDTAQDTRIAARRARTDLRTELRDLRTTRRRGVQDIRTSRQRGLREVRYGREDTRTQFERGQQDFGLQLDSLTRRFSALGRSHTQIANAQGVLDGGTAEASAAARERNLEFAQQPIFLGQQRLTEDTERALGRLDTQAGDIRQDTKRERKRLVQDVRHDTRLTHRDYRQTLRDLHNQLQRAIREQRIGDIDLIKQEIYNARQNKPGTFNEYGGRK